MIELESYQGGNVSVMFMPFNSLSTRQLIVSPFYLEKVPSLKFQVRNMPSTWNLKLGTISEISSDA